MQVQDELKALRAELEAMRGELDALRRQQTDVGSTSGGAASEATPTVSRRQWIKAAAAVAVGGTAVALGPSERAAAADGDNFRIGNLGTPGSPQLATSPTQLNYTGTEDNAFVVQSGTQFLATSSSFDAAISGWTTRSVNPVGVYGFSNNLVGPNGKGVLGRSDSANTVGVEGQGQGSGSVGVRGLALAGGTTGVSGSGPVGVHGTGPVGVHGEGSGANSIGVDASGNIGVNAEGSVHGGSFSGNQAALLLLPKLSTPPGLRAGAHTAGEIEGNLPGPGTNELWVCVASGTPGTWRRLAGPSTAGAFTAINPVRVYDSRSAAPEPGVLSAGQDRVISVADGRDTGNGSVITPNAVPAGATAVAFNLTVADTTSLGFLSITPGDATSSPASTINWTANGLALANAGIVKLDDARRVKVFCGGLGTTNFIVDITGYFL